MKTKRLPVGQEGKKEKEQRYALSASLNTEKKKSLQGQKQGKVQKAYKKERKKRSWHEENLEGREEGYSTGTAALTARPGGRGEKKWKRQKHTFSVGRKGKLVRKIWSLTKGKARKKSVLKKRPNGSSGVGRPKRGDVGGRGPMPPNYYYLQWGLESDRRGQKQGRLGRGGGGSINHLYRDATGRPVSGEKKRSLASKK